MTSAAWFRVSDVVQKVTGRAIVGTSGGDYVVTPREICVPWGSTEGLVHELCHYAVATPQERPLLNFGLSQDWRHPGWDRMVLAEELAWSLEFYLYGDPSADAMARLMTPEARASGSGASLSQRELEKIEEYRRNHGMPQTERYTSEKTRRLKAASKWSPESGEIVPERARDTLAIDDVIAVAIVEQLTPVRLTASAIAEMKRANELIYKGEIVTYDPQLREEALKLARRAGIPLDELRELLKAEST